MAEKYDFSGWATKVGLLCSDGRIIDKDAFKECDGKVVPLVWNHQHDDPDNVLGHALLKNYPEGMRSFCTFNATEKGKNAKLLVEHGDINSLSIYANKLKQNGPNVVHGVIREVSLVLAGANPGAFIDEVNLEHSDDSDGEDAVIYTGESLELVHAEEEQKEEPKEEPKEEIAHAEEPKKEEKKKLTVKDVYEAMSQEKKDAIAMVIGLSLGEGESEGGEAKHSDESIEHADGKTLGDVIETFTEDELKVLYVLLDAANKNKSNKKEETKGDNNMKHSVFDNDSMESNAIQHADMKTIFRDAKTYGSLKEACLAHSVTDDDGNTVTYGIANIDYLFPDAKTVNKTPDFIKREDSWVRAVLNGTHHTPFSRVKSIHANITMDEARAKGYVKGNEKAEEVFSLLTRTTPPQTIYKKQKFDRDDLIDIVDFDAVAWVKQEMRMMLDEEIARAILVGDGRSVSSPDKIFPTNIRPIWTDDTAVYCVNGKVTVAANATEDQIAKAFIRAAVKNRKFYKGSGSPTLFTTEDVLTDCLLLEDQVGRVIYDTEEKLRNALRVSRIVTVPVMENLTRTVGNENRELMGIIVNLNDYNVGADKGGAVSLFNDFDIDFNQEKYLIETRCSGALIKPFSAIVLEKVVAASNESENH